MQFNAASIHLLITDYLYDRTAINYLTINKHFKRYIYVLYSCKQYYIAEDFITIPSIIKKVITFGHKELQQYSHLSHIEFQWSFNQAVDDLIPNKITALYFGYAFNRPINNLPQTLTKLVLDDSFNQPIDHLPHRLTHLTLGYHFNQEINNLPKSLTHLTLSWCFNQPVNNLPQDLTHLVLGFRFNQSLNQLPASLVHLTLGFSYNRPIDKLPTNLSYLSFGFVFNQAIDIGSLTPNLVSLKFGNAFDQIVSNLHKCVFMKELIFGKFYKCNIESLPPNIQFLTIRQKHSICKRLLSSGIVVISPD